LHVDHDVIALVNASFVSGKFLGEVHTVELPSTCMDTSGTLAEFQQ